MREIINIDLAFLYYKARMISPAYTTPFTLGLSLRTRVTTRAKIIEIVKLLYQINPIHSSSESALASKAWAFVYWFSLPILISLIGFYNFDTIIFAVTYLKKIKIIVKIK